MRNSTHNDHNEGIFPPNQENFFQFLNDGRKDLPPPPTPNPLPRSSYAPVHPNAFLKAVSRQMSYKNGLHVQNFSQHVKTLI